MLKNKKNINKILYIIAIINLFNIIIIAPLYFISFNENYYFNYFEKYDLYDNINANKEQIQGNFSQVLNYVKGDINYIGIGIFNEREILHLKDVKNLFYFGKLLLAIHAFLLIIIFSYLNKQLIFDILKKSSIFCLSFLSLVTLYSLIDFTTTFIIFHEILFTNDLWILSYQTDNLIRILPEELFFELGLKWFALSGFFSLSIYLISIQNKIKKWFKYFLSLIKDTNY
ncbi:MAG: TIGR01906 family membrane protein [Candidatus Woesearchaeota archaeon]